MPLTTYTAGEVLTASSLNANFTFAASNAGLTLIKTQTIGSAVASVTVTDAFSATYDNYKIIVTGGAASSQTTLTIALGASTTGYYQGMAACNYSTGTVTGRRTNNGATFERSGSGNANGLLLNADLNSPFLAKYTGISAPFVYSDEAGQSNGFHGVATSYTSFILATGAGTMTGGTIYVYGYKIS